MSTQLATLSGFTTARASLSRTASKGARFARGVVRCEAKKKSVGDLTEKDLKDQVVFVRCDLNVPLDGDLNITDDTRIRAAIPTLEYLTKNGAKVLVTSHLVRDRFDARADVDRVTIVSSGRGRDDRDRSIDRSRRRGRDDDD